MTSRTKPSRAFAAILLSSLWAAPCLADRLAEHVRFANDAEISAWASATGRVFAYSAGPSLRTAIERALSGKEPLPSMLIAPMTAPSSMSDHGLLAYGSASKAYAPGACRVSLFQGPHGESSISSWIERAMGAKLSPALAERMFAFEALHEAGHCAAVEYSARFAHPDLSAGLNAEIASWLASETALGDAWHESFADAYAIVKIIDSAAIDPEALRLARTDASLILAWRRMCRDGQEIAAPDGTLRLPSERSEHMTENAISELLERPASFFGFGLDASARASEIASIGLVRQVLASAHGPNGPAAPAAGTAASLAWLGARLAEADRPERAPPAGPEALAAMRALPFGSIAYDPSFYSEPKTFSRRINALDAFEPIAHPPAVPSSN
jgi:hypothetical protein